jgi:uncharacterized coiled-coil protein SlyX
MVPEQLWRAGRLAGLVVALASVSLAQTANDDVAQLKAQVAQLQKQLELLSQKLEQVVEAKKGESAAAAQAVNATVPAAQAGNATAPATPEARAYPPSSLTASTTTAAAPLPAAAPPAVSSPIMNPPLPKVAAPPQPVTGTSSPLQILLGDIAITPVGFMDLTATWKNTNATGSLGTNFGNFPYNNTLPQSRLSEWRFSPQNSRLGFRIDGVYKGLRFIGYNEFDFLGTSGSNSITVTNGAFVPRLRLFWVDVRKNKFEFLAGQSWSMMTPNRKGISPLPGDIFYSQVMDVNYLIGLPWSRQPGVRFVYHPSDKVAIGFSAENPEQYIGGSGGGPTVTLPACCTSFAGVQLDNGTTVQSIPNLTPDFIAKVAFDPTPRVHFEVNGMLRNFKIYNTAGVNIGKYSTVTGGAGAVNGNFEVVKNFRLISNNYWSDGGGRYLFGEVPDLIMRGNGTISLIHAGGFNEGFEATAGKFLIYGYYAASYARRNVAIDTNGSFVGYGYPGAPNSQNKAIQEVTGGYNQTLWKDPKYGALNIITQYAWFVRNPWYIAPNSPKAAHLNTIWVDVRYTLPGSAPTIGK